MDHTLNGAPRRYVTVVCELSYAYGLNPASGFPWSWRNVLDAATVKRHTRSMRRRFPGISIWLERHRP